MGRRPGPHVSLLSTTAPSVEQHDEEGRLGIASAAAGPPCYYVWHRSFISFRDCACKSSAHSTVTDAAVQQQDAV